MYRVGCYPLLDRELTLRVVVAEIVGICVGVSVGGIRGDEDSLSFGSSNCVWN